MRTVAIRWFLPAIPWAGLVGVVAVHFALTPPAALLTALVGFAIVGVFGLFGLQARRHGIAPTRLVVELTEREAVEDMDRLRHALGSLRRHGVRIAADDVGAGNAGLRLISEVTFDVLKIDLTLVRAGAVRNPTDGVLRALRDLAGRRSQSIVAEGVETAEELAVVMGLWFDSAQGYLLGRPAPTLSAGDLDLRALAGRPTPAREPAAPGAPQPVG